MKISIYYEQKNQMTILEVPDEECEEWVERDYQNRLAKAENKALVERRTAQQIMDEDFNKPTFNRNQTESRRHVLLSALDPKECYLTDEAEPLQEILMREKYEGLYRAMEKLEPRQKELLRRIFWEGEKQAEIAEKEHVTEAAVSGRMQRIYASLRKSLKQKNF